MKSIFGGRALCNEGKVADFNSQNISNSMWAISRSLNSTRTHWVKRNFINWNVSNQATLGGRANSTSVRPHPDRSFCGVVSSTLLIDGPEAVAKDFHYGECPSKNLQKPMNNQHFSIQINENSIKINEKSININEKSIKINEQLIKSMRNQ